MGSEVKFLSSLLFSFVPPLSRDRQTLELRYETQTYPKRIGCTLHKNKRPANRNKRPILCERII